jgi:HAD superfamily hydrolase (TIGR01549 family)
MTAVNLEAVTFDYWNTLIAEDHSRRTEQIAAWVTALNARGYAVTTGQVNESFAGAWKAYEQRWEANIQTEFADVVEVILTALDLHPRSDVITELVDIQAQLAASQEMPLIDGVATAVSALREQGVRVGIICDVGVTPSTVLRSRLEWNDILDRFDHWSFSDDVGVYKPDPRIFEHAMAGLRVNDPAKMAHVGDLRRTDIAGAQSMGMTAVRFRGVLDDPSTETNPYEGDHVIDHHDQLLEALGLR